VDGTSNPDSANRVTMTIVDPVTGAQAEPAGLGPAHKLPVYLEGAAAADASSDASLRASVGALGVLIGAGAPATRELYRFTRPLGGSRPTPSTKAPPRVTSSSRTTPPAASPTGTAGGSSAGGPTRWRLASGGHPSGNQPPAK
jgi:hypothetical protein